MKRVHKLSSLAMLIAAAGHASAFAASDPPLPSLETVYQGVLERAAKEDENERTFKQSYYYTRSRVTEFRNSKGALKKREDKQGENDPLLAVSRNQQSKVTKQVVSSKNAEQAGAVSDTHSNVRGKPFQKNDFPLNGDLVSRFDFMLLGREIVNGRPALVIDFSPVKKKLPERNIKDRFINKAAGRVWVDEAEYALVKADLRLTERVDVVGGLVGAVWKFTLGLMRDRTPDGLWFVRDLDWHLEGRELFLRRVVDYHEERKDVRPAR